MRLRAPLAAVLLAGFLAPVGLAAHECGHLLVLWLMGGSGVLVARPWNVGGVELLAFHARPDAALAPVPNLVFDFGGPALAALPFLALLLAVGPGAARAALAANAGILGFFALLESAYVVLERFLGVDGDLLLSPALNFGVPALVVVAASALAAPSRREPARTR